MSIATRKLSLIERLMRIRKKGILDELEDILIRAEMESRTSESLKAISTYDTKSLNQVAQENQAWIKKRSTK